MARTLIVFGARRGTGLALARLARQRDLAVTAVVRPGSNAGAVTALGCTIAYADALSPHEVSQVLAGAGAQTIVVSTLGGAGNVDEIGNGHVIDAAVAAGVGALWLVSSLGAGDSRAYASKRLLDAIGTVLEAKTRAEDRLKASGLRHVIIRPGGLLDTPATGNARLLDAPDVHGFIGRTDLAALILGGLDDEQLTNKTFAAIDPSCHPPPRSI